MTQPVVRRPTTQPYRIFDQRIKLFLPLPEELRSPFRT